MVRCEDVVDTQACVCAMRVARCVVRLAQAAVKLLPSRRCVMRPGCTRLCVDRPAFCMLGSRPHAWLLTFTYYLLPLACWRMGFTQSLYTSARSAKATHQASPRP